LHLGHLRLLVQVAEMGAVVMPPMRSNPRPATLEEVIDQTVNRDLDLLGLELPQDLFRRWEGANGKAPRQPLRHDNSSSEPATGKAWG
jgi:4-hydroxy-3-polyprenylbenzoate decarboxylase